MADNQTVGNTTGQPQDYVVSADKNETTLALLQRFKLAVSADGSEAHVPSDERGLLVQFPSHVMEVFEKLLEATQALTPTGGRNLDRLTDSLAVAVASDAVTVGKRDLRPNFGFANVSASSTDAQVVAALEGQKIRVLAFRLHCGATATTLTFNTKPAGIAGQAVTEQFQIGANSGRADGLSELGHFETNPGHALTATTGTGSTVGVGVVYIYV